jgi:hypothetical protein
MRAMEAIATMRRRTTDASAGSFILSMTHGHEDMLAALRLASAAGLVRPAEGTARVSIVPLFETLVDLERCPDELERALGDSRASLHPPSRSTAPNAPWPRSPGGTASRSPSFITAGAARSVGAAALPGAPSKDCLRAPSRGASS